MKRLAVPTVLLLSSCASLLGGQEEVDQVFEEAGAVFIASVALVDVEPSEFRLGIVSDEAGYLSEQAVVVRGRAVVGDLTSEAVSASFADVVAYWDGLPSSHRLPPLTMDGEPIPEDPDRKVEEWWVNGGSLKRGGYGLSISGHLDTGRLLLSVWSGCYRGVPQV